MVAHCCDGLTACNDVDAAMAADTADKRRDERLAAEQRRAERCIDRAVPPPSRFPVRPAVIWRRAQAMLRPGCPALQLHPAKLGRPGSGSSRWHWK